MVVAMVGRERSTSDARTYAGDARDEFRLGDVLCFRGRDGISWFVRGITRSRYSHAGLVYPYEGRVYCMEAVASGVRLILMSELVRRYRGGIDYYELINANDAERHAAMSFCFRQLGKLYDTAGLFRFLWGITTGRMERLRNKDQWMCSELVVRAYREAGVNLVELAAAYTSPGDLSISDRLRFKFGVKQ